MAGKKPSSIFTPNMSPWNALPDALKGSAHDVWLAGLAALSRAQQEGGKVVDALVQEGLAIQRKTQAVAQDKAREAGERAHHLASELGDKASGQLGKLESIFEDRVARALQGLGMPTAYDVKALAERVAALEQALASSAQSAKPAAKRKSAVASKAPPKAPSKGRAAARTAPRKPA